MRRPLLWFERVAAWKPIHRLMGVVCGLGLAWFTWSIATDWAKGPILLWYSARSWKEYPAEIIESHVDNFGDLDRMLRRIAVSYRYQVGGQSFVGKRYDLYLGYRKVPQDVLDREIIHVPPGRTVSCWVNPAVPSQATLDRSWSVQASAAVFLVFVVLASSVGMLGVSAFGPLVARRHQRWWTAAILKASYSGSLTWPTGIPTDPWVEPNVAIVISPSDRIVAAASGSFYMLYLSAGLLFQWRSHALEGVPGRGIPFLCMYGAMLLLVACGTMALWFRAFKPKWVALISPLPDGNGGEVVVSFSVVPSATRAALTRFDFRAQLVAREGRLGFVAKSPARVAPPEKRAWRWNRQPQSLLASIDVPLRNDGQAVRVQLPPHRPIPPVRFARGRSWWFRVTIGSRLAEGGQVNQQPIPPYPPATNSVRSVTSGKPFGTNLA